ncbi:MAG: Integral membrane sensor hybrid histidine kinase [Parcubacteria group bacterium GW2011_GWA1_47_8]|nr:MAG: Integral membrane sensor hybrid histidine kinase [Parcubacteria group bacterium GW2011_GWA1_47_8]KKW07523.1 MAG: Integral membrane sensor hybrid histidine kinase [Parcubacteria group bacterium GW2011_GWA2_49_16]
MPVELQLYEFIFYFGIITNLMLGGFVLFHSRKQIDTAVVTFLFLTLMVVLFQVSHILGIKAPNAETSEVFFALSMTGSVLILVFMVHWIFVLTGIRSKRKFVLTLIYITGIGIALAEIFIPEAFFLPSVPKMYFPYYYVPGPWEWIMHLWYTLVTVYLLIELSIAYQCEDNFITKNRLRYVFFSLFYALSVSATGALLFYDIQFDPLFSSLFGFYTIPLAYVLIRYELFDIRILAKRAILYGVVTIGFGLLIMGMNNVNEYLQIIDPDFPKWIGQAFIAALVGGLALFVWNKAREADILKYEFTTIITHKFRTPLTRIRWAIAEASKGKERLTQEQMQDTIRTVANANDQLVELTDTLITLNDMGNMERGYQETAVSLNQLVERMVQAYVPFFQDKHIVLLSHITNEGLVVKADPKKLEFVLQIIFNNALAYTHPQGTVRVSLAKEDHRVVLVVADTGIGISAINLPHIFDKFYRAANTSGTNTDGTGVGLFMVKKIMERNGGEVAASSLGEGKGSTFTLTFPLQ